MSPRLGLGFGDRDDYLYKEGKLNETIERVVYINNEFVIENRKCVNKRLIYTNKGEKVVVIDLNRNLTVFSKKILRKMLSRTKTEYLEFMFNDVMYKVEVEVKIDALVITKASSI
ncbi:hypothetical protein H5410_019530 [Solanum commersonii]|uniref:Uncharacterized protein n=1 Tax=Solanum commersonii TaxID=4109 RepID=A0A9J5Z5V7_SOLCO|nr:hypothetical protein H5410_019530 [Solanum commersonii]